MCVLVLHSLFLRLGRGGIKFLLIWCGINFVVTRLYVIITNYEGTILSYLIKIKGKRIWIYESIITNKALNANGFKVLCIYVCVCVW